MDPVNFSLTIEVPHAKFEAFTAMIFQVEVFWVVKPCTTLKDGGSMDL
jgi:hypothetical protein